jgi:hypothetical protein
MSAIPVASGRKAWPHFANAAVLVGLLIGGFLGMGLGWVLSGGALWAAPTWAHREKLLGTLVFPGGLMGAFYFASLVTPRSCVGSSHLTPAGMWDTVQHCTGGSQSIITLIFGLLVIAPLGSVTYLWLAARGRRG